jgi:UDP-N-acetylmuramoylalanine--D-glutamate ligase
MASEPDRVRAVVAIGEAAPDVRAVFASTTEVVDAGSMADAVRLAADLARPGDAVVLSPGCASFDWYRGYPARGDDFRRLVDELVLHPGRDAEPSDHLPAGHVPTDRVPTDRVPTDRVPTDRVPTDRVPTDRVPTDHRPSEGAPR